MKELNEGWVNITLKEYISYIDCYNSYKDDKDINIYLLAILEKSDFKTISELPLGILRNKMDKWSFMAEDFSKLEVQNPQIDIGGKLYMINKDFNALSLMQWQNVDELLKSNNSDNSFKNINKLIAITSQLRTEFNDDTTDKLSESILNTPMLYVIPSIVFFFNSDSNYVENILTCLRKIQEDQIMEMEVTLSKLKISIGTGVGLVRPSRWRMMIFLSLMKFWLWMYKRFSLI